MSCSQTKTQTHLITREETRSRRFLNVNTGRNHSLSPFFVDTPSTQQPYTAGAIEQKEGEHYNQQEKDDLFYHQIVTEINQSDISNGRDLTLEDWENMYATLGEIVERLKDKESWEAPTLTSTEKATLQAAGLLGFVVGFLHADYGLFSSFVQELGAAIQNGWHSVSHLATSSLAFGPVLVPITALISIYLTKTLKSRIEKFHTKVTAMSEAYLNELTRLENGVEAAIQNFFNVLDRVASSETDWQQSLQMRNAAFRLEDSLDRYRKMIEKGMQQIDIFRQEVSKARTDARIAKRSGKLILVGGVASAIIVMCSGGGAVPILAAAAGAAGGAYTIKLSKDALKECDDLSKELNELESLLKEHDMKYKEKMRRIVHDILPRAEGQLNTKRLEAKAKKAQAENEALKREQQHMKAQNEQMAAKLAKLAALGINLDDL